MQAQFALFAPKIAKEIGDRHEKQGMDRKQPIGEANMDLWNNRQGREIANEIKDENPLFLLLGDKINDIIAQKIMERMRAGKLITNPNDKRKFVETGFAAPVEDIEYIFTRDEISQMSQEEFAQHEAEIMEQVQNGKFTDKKVDYSKFTNPLTGRKKVYTKEEVNKMSGDDYSANEQEIMAQVNAIGLPSHSDVYKQSSTAAGKDGKWVTINGNHVLIEK